MSCTSAVSCGRPTAGWWISRRQAPVYQVLPAAVSGWSQGDRALTFRTALAGGQLDRPPAVPGDDAAVRVVGLAEDVELPGRRRRDVPRQAVPAAHAQVARWPDVQSAELEHEEDLSGPPPDAAHAGQASDDLSVARAR